MTQSLRLLLIEDVEDDALLLVRELRKRGIDPDFARVETPQELESALDSSTWDAVISDYKMPGFSGLDALRIVRESGTDLPFILVSGVIGEEQAVEAMKAGAHDFILKGSYARLVPALERELEEAESRRQKRLGEEELAYYREHLEKLVQERSVELQAANATLRDSRLAALNMMEDAVAARRQTEEANSELRESELFYRQTLESIPGMVFTTRPDGYCDYQSQQWVDFTGVPMSEHLGDGWNKLLHPDDRPRAYAAWRAAVEERAPYDLEYRVRRHDGAYEWFKVRGRPIRNTAGEIVRWFGTALNIDHMLKAQEALRESEEQVRRKLESILTPEGDIGNLDLADIIDARSFQSLVDDFYGITGMPVGLIDTKGKILVGVGWQDICTKFHRVNPETCRHCVESDVQLSAGVPHGEYKIYKCKNNMWDVATPVIVGDRQFGNLFIGQFFFEDEPIDYEFFRSQARQYGFDETEYIAALEAVPRLSRETLDTSMAFFMKLADILSKLSYSNIKLARSLAELDSLMESLRRAHDELEQRVRERTEELATTVETLLGEITVRERTEENLQRLNRLYAVLSETDQAIVRVTDRESLFRDFCRIAVEHGGFLLSCVGLVDVESGQLRMAAACGATGYLDDIRITADEEPAGEGPTGISIREGTYYISNDFQNDPCTRPWHERGRAHGIRASASIALKQEGRVIGALALYAGEKDFFDRQHVELLRQMGADISFALDNLGRETRRRKAEDALKIETARRLQALEELRVKEQLLMQQSRQAAMGEMIGNIAHQWRQPLNILGLIIQELPVVHEPGVSGKGEIDACVAKAMQVISHMSQTIDDFRNFFRPDKEKVLFKINDIVAKTVSLIDGSFREQRIKIDISAQEDISIYGYPNEYSQVILNILLNARDAFAERKTDEPRIVLIKLIREDDKAVVTITDNAGGIAEDILEKVFDPYFTTKGPDKGTGIGLFMAKTIIEKNMGGRLHAGNTGDGAEFRIEV